MAVGLLSGTAHADTTTTWSTNQTISITQAIDDGVTITADITLTIPAGVTLTVNGGINADSHTLTVSGDGTLNVTGTDGTNGTGGDGTGGTVGSDGFTGTMIVNGATVNVTGGNGGAGGNGKAITETITYSAGVIVQESDNNSTWTAINGTSSSKRYVKAGTGVTYIKYTLSGDKVTSAEETILPDAIVSTSTTTFEDGKFYVVNSNVTVSSRITVNGTANLILCDGATLTANAGITVP